MEELTPASEKGYTIISAMETARHFTSPGMEECSEIVAGWVRGRALFEGRSKEEGHGLQRRALFALSVLQKEKAGDYTDVWTSYFKACHDAPTRYYYVSAAFIGAVFAAQEVPAHHVVRLLTLHEEAQKAGEALPTRNALRAFWRAWPLQEARGALVARVMEEKTPESTWQMLSELSRPNAFLFGWHYERMSQLRKKAPRTPWDAPGIPASDGVR
jgi:hypothetical protein